MTVQSDASFAGPYVPNGVTTVFPFGFAVPSDLEIEVVIDDLTVDPSLYSVTLAPDSNSGSVRFTSAPTGAALFIQSAPDFTQATSLGNQAAYFPRTIEAAFDRAAIRDNWLKARLAAGQLPDGAVIDALGASPTSAPSQRAVGAAFAAFSSQGGSSLVGYQAPYSGAAVRTTYNKFNDQRVVTPEDFGAVGDVLNDDGSINPTPTDDTIALKAALSVLGPNVRLQLNRAYAFSDTLTAPLRDYAEIRGLGRYSCGLWYIGASTTKSLLVIGDGSREMLGWHLSNFFIDSRTKMTAGVGLWFRLHRFAVRTNLAIQGQYNKLNGGPGIVNTNRKLWNGALFEDDFLGCWDDCDTVARNDGLQLVGGASSVYRGGRTMLCTTGVHIGGGVSCTFDDMDVINCVQDDMLIDNALRAAANAQIFLKSGLTLDFCGRDNLRVNDTLETNNYLQVDCWLASAGAHGLHVIRYGTSAFSRIQRSAGRVTNCVGNGVMVETNTPIIDISGGAIDFNAGYGLATTSVGDTNLSIRSAANRSNGLGLVSGLINGYAINFAPAIASSDGPLTGYTLGPCYYTQSGNIGTNEFIDFALTVTLPNPLPTSTGQLRFGLPLGVTPVQGAGQGGTTDSNVLSWVRYGAGVGLLVKYDGTTPLIAGKTYTINGRIQRP
jgi:hypothetical protein